MAWEDNITSESLTPPFAITNYDVLEKYYGNIEFKSGFVILNKSNDILMVHQSTGNVGFPKGSRDNNDASAYETAVRELTEETNLLSCNYTVYPNILHYYRGKCNELTIYFVAKLNYDVPIYVDGNEIINYSWMKISNLDTIRKKSVPTRRIINALKRAEIK